jgi:integrase
MGRHATGQVVEDRRLKSPTFALRFSAYGTRRYLTLGSKADGWDRARAERELAHIVADVERGLWRPAEAAPVAAAPRECPTFHEYATEWFERQKLEGGRRAGGLSPAGVADLEWRITYHLLPFFADMRLDEIRVEDVDRFRLSKVRERDEIDKAIAKGKPLMEDYTDPRTGRTWRRRRTALGAVSINKLIGTLSAILEVAVEHELVTRNTAHGRRRRLASVTPTRTFLDQASQISALLDAAGQLDENGQRRALLATLTFAGLRISEALALRWADVDLHRKTIRVRASKTDAGVRTVNIVAVLQHELREYKARVIGEADALVFATATGGEHSASNVRSRVLAKAVVLANEQLAKAGSELIPTSLTPHSLRRTFASILFAVGEPLPYAMSQLGHADTKMTLGVYARAMSRRDGEAERLRELVEGTVISAAKGSKADSEAGDERKTRAR